MLSGVVEYTQNKSYVAVERNIRTVAERTRNSLVSRLSK
jgi:hypothetical protein